MRLDLKLGQEGAGTPTHSPTAVGMVARAGPGGDAGDQGMALIVKGRLM